MSEPLAGQVKKRINKADQLDNCLILMTGLLRSGSMSALHEATASTSSITNNENLEPSCKITGLTEQQRVLYLLRLYDEIANETKEEVGLFDNTELLFDIHLKQDPLHILCKTVSRQSVIYNQGNRQHFLDYKNAKNIDAIIEKHPESLDDQALGWAYYEASQLIMEKKGQPAHATGCRIWEYEFKWTKGKAARQGYHPFLLSTSATLLTLILRHTKEK